MPGAGLAIAAMIQSMRNNRALLKSVRNPFKHSRYQYSSPDDNKPLENRQFFEEELQRFHEDWRRQKKREQRRSLLLLIVAIVIIALCGYALYRVLTT